MSVSFYFDEIKKPKEFSIKNFRVWLQSIENHYQINIKKLTYIFVNDEKLLNINQQFLSHDTYTDIITFNLSNEKEIIAGEIYISLDRIAENAQKFGVLFLDELLRVAAHGLLHLIGFDDKNKQKKTLMTQEENLCIKLYYQL
jgi:rRNA maturation RNase YbeY